jgi:hypothetical protein
MGKMLKGGLKSRDLNSIRWLPAVYSASDHNASSKTLPLAKAVSPQGTVAILALIRERRLG